MILLFSSLRPDNKINKIENKPYYIITIVLYYNKSYYIITKLKEPIIQLINCVTNTQLIK